MNLRGMTALGAVAAFCLLLAAHVWNRGRIRLPHHWSSPPPADPRRAGLFLVAYLLVLSAGLLPVPWMIHSLPWRWSSGILGGEAAVLLGVAGWGILKWGRSKGGESH